MGFLGLSLLLDAVAVAPFALLAAWLLARTGRFRRRQLIFTAACLGGLPIAVAIFVRFQVVRYFGAANRDPRRFRDADALDITRTPNPHIAFGSGIHYCLGAPLARLEGRVAISELLARHPGIEVAVERDSLEWNPGFFLRGVRSLPVSL